MTGPITSDTARLPVMLTQLRLPTVARLWPTISETADREGWPAARTLAALLEHEIAERAQRRIARHLLEARLPSGKTLDGFDFTAVSSLSKARVVALAEGDAWLAQGTNILLFGPPGVGKSHLAAALGHALIDAGYRVLLAWKSSPAFVREPEGNGCAERFIRVLKENLLWVRRFDTVEELRLALQRFRQAYNQTWIIERHGYLTPAQVRADQITRMPLAA